MKDRQRNGLILPSNAVLFLSIVIGNQVITHSLVLIALRVCKIWPVTVDDLQKKWRWVASQDQTNLVYWRVSNQQDKSILRDKKKNIAVLCYLKNNGVLYQSELVKG